MRKQNGRRQLPSEEKKEIEKLIETAISIVIAQKQQLARFLKQIVTLAV